MFLLTLFEQTIALLNLAYIYGSPYFTKMVPIYETAVEPEMDYIGLGMVSDWIDTNATT